MWKQVHLQKVLEVRPGRGVVTISPILGRAEVFLVPLLKSVKYVTLVVDNPISAGDLSCESVLCFLYLCQRLVGDNDSAF